jgi:hypothetical protein
MGYSSEQSCVAGLATDEVINDSVKEFNKKMTLGDKEGAVGIFSTFLGLRYTPADFLIGGPNLAWEMTRQLAGQLIKAGALLHCSQKHCVKGGNIIDEYK